MEGGRKRMLARFSVLDKYECPTDFLATRLSWTHRLKNRAHDSLRDETNFDRWQEAPGWVGPSIVIPANHAKTLSGRDG